MTPYSELRDGSRVDLADNLPLPLPYTVLIEPTNVCNFKCRFCPESFEDYHEQVGGKTKMGWATYERIVSEIKAIGVLKALKFYMLGESLLYPELPAMIRLAKKEGIAERTELTTNASALTVQKGFELMNAGLDYLRVSIYGMNPEKHRQITQSNVSPDKIRMNVRMFKVMRLIADSPSPFLYVKMLDGGDEEENRLFLKAYGSIADEVCLEQPMNWSGYEERDLIGNARQGATVAQSKPFKRVCPFPFYTMVINANGDVTCCCVDWSKKTKVGNVHESSLEEIWKGEPLREFRRMHLEGRRHENAACRNCDYLFTVPDDLDSLPRDEWERILA